MKELQETAVAGQPAGGNTRLCGKQSSQKMLRIAMELVPYNIAEL